MCSSDLIQFDYNSKGKLELVTLPDSKTIEYTYDEAKGRLTTITAPGGETLSYSHDGPLPLSTTWTGTINGSVSRTYNNNFWITSHMVNGGSAITYQYDNDGLLTGAGDLTISRNAQNGLITGATLGSVNDTRGYNAFGEVVDYRATYSTSEIFLTHFEQDKIGRITEKTETVDGAAHVYNYEYDATGRLIRVKKDSALISEYTYDGNGNRLSHNTIIGTYDAQDRLITYGNNTYTHTTNGELLTRTDTSTSETTTYTYDVLGNLVSVTLPDGRQIEYVIDGMNRRIGKKVNNMVQGFLYQGSLRPIAELDNNGIIVSRFIYATRINVPDYMIKGGVTYRIITDHLGSPRLVVNTSTGQIVQRMDYDEFGNATNDTNPGFQPFGFAGGLYDPDTKLVRFGARDYDPETGRWTAKDPIGFGGGQPNLYQYVGANPINRRDYTGLLPPLPGPSDVGEFLDETIGGTIEFTSQLCTAAERGGYGHPVIEAGCEVVSLVEYGWDISGEIAEGVNICVGWIVDKLSGTPEITIPSILWIDEPSRPLRDILVNDPTTWFFFDEDVPRGFFDYW